MLLELDYINRISPQLERFHWTRSSKQALFRCPYCGDSHKDKRKTRGSLFYIQSSGQFMFNCFNCGVGRTFRNFLKDNFPQVHLDYKLERLKEYHQSHQITQVAQLTPDVVAIEQTSNVKPVTPDVNWTELSKLDIDHPAVQYCKSRLIPESSFHRIMYTPSLSTLIDSLTVANPYEKIPNKEFIVFPMKTREGKVFGLQARSIGGKTFITTKFCDNIDKSFGLDVVNPSLPVFVTEAAIDSLFLANSIALMGGDVTSSILEGMDINNVYVALDNEPRHRDTVNRMKKAVDMGLKVCFWKIDSKYKDINNMVEHGFSSREIMSHIIENSYSGLAAKMKLAQWKKV